MPEVIRNADVQAKILAGRILSMGAGRASAALDHISSWLLSGFGAAFALLFANIDAVSRHIDLGSLRIGLRLFLGALILGVISKYLSAIVVAGAEAAAHGNAMGREIMDQKLEINVDTFFEESKRAVYWPVRIMVESTFEKASSGDFAVAGRVNAKIAQIQGFMIVAEVLIAVASAVVLSHGMTV